MNSGVDLQGDCDGGVTSLREAVGVLMERNYGSKVELWQMDAGLPTDIQDSGPRTFELCRIYSIWKGCYFAGLALQHAYE